MVSDPNFVAPKKVFPQAISKSEADYFEDQAVDIDDEEFEM